MAGTRQANTQRIFVEPSGTGALARYEILEVIGGAERSQVYRARDIEGRPTVSITVLDSECALDAGLRHRLLDEAHRASRLSHPRIASIYGAGEDRNHLYVISEDVAGTPLTRLLANRHLSSRRAIGLAAEIAATVADAHALGLAHCHLTADRVIVDATGAPILLDFGLATWGECARRARPSPCLDEATAYAIDVAAIGSLLLDMAGHRLRSLDARPRPPSLGPSARPTRPGSPIRVDGSAPAGAR